MTNLKVATVLLICLLSSPVAMGQSNSCEIVPKGLLGEPHSEWRGFYDNKVYEYSVVIPAGLVGYDVAPPAPLHGFGIPLGEAPQSYIFVSGEWNSLEDSDPVDVAVRHLRYLREGGKTIESATITISRLGELRAAELAVSYACAGSNVRYMQFSTFALASDGGTLYEITLYCLAERYALDRTVLIKVLQSWKRRAKRKAGGQCSEVCLFGA